MPMETHSFKRLVLGLQPSASDRGIRLAVELADLLQLDLLGLLLEDTSLKRLVNIPFAREFQPLGGGWRSIDPDQLSRDFELAARGIQRMFSEAAKHLATRWQFDIARGSTADLIASISQTDDIVMVVEPVRPGEHVTQQFEWLIQAAFQSAAAVMFVPGQVARNKGPIAAIAATPDDPSIRAAAAIAIAAKEDLLIVDACEPRIDEAQVRALSADTDLAVIRIAIGRPLLSDPTAFSYAFRQVQERLLVITRGIVEDAAASTIAAARRVPVLVIEPSKMAMDTPVPQPDAKKRPIT